MLGNLGFSPVVLYAREHASCFQHTKETPMLIRALAAAVALAAFSATGEAKIACRDGYQRVQGQDIATPYCQDKLVAQVAREHGSRVRDNSILYNPSAKAEACRFVGHDTRLTTACAGENDRGRRF
jgi:hypothetical protein